MANQTVCFDFDGVIHSYVSGWKGVDCIPDPPVPGIREAIKDIRAVGYNVAVLSARCNSEDGLRAIEEYLKRHKIEFDEVVSKKPGAVVYIDDRAICFDGDPYTLLEKIRKFRTWQERDPDITKIKYVIDGKPGEVMVSSSLTEEEMVDAVSKALVNDMFLKRDSTESYDIAKLWYENRSRRENNV